MSTTTSISEEPHVDLVPEQVATFEREGYLLLEDVFPADAIGGMCAALEAVAAVPRPSRVVEKDNKTVRSVYGSHLHDSRFDALARDPKLVRAARMLLGGEVYVYQFKVNIKEAFAGDIWEWHQDYIYWQREDGLPRHDIITFATFLDDVTEFNGPITLIPASHTSGVIEPRIPAIPITEDRRQPYQDRPAWIANLTATLKYSVDNERLKALTNRHGMIAPKAKAGATLVFHSEMVHGSAPNISPYPRRVALVTYCRTDNVPSVPSTRPDFLCAKDHSPLRATDE